MNYTNKTKYLIVGTVIAVAFLAVVSMPASTNACGSYDCGYSYNYRPYQTNLTYNQFPVTYAQGTGYYQQPTYVQQPVYVQPQIVQPVYIAQPVIQQPVIVQQPVYVAPRIIQPVIQQPVIVQQPVFQQSNFSLDVGCYVDPTNARVNQPVTWSVEVVGGMGPYTYNWSGTDNLTGSMSSIIKYYNTPGSKSAIVSVTSADGRTATRACSNSLTIAGASNYSYKAPTKAPVVVVAEPVVTNNSTQAAASIFSLSNVPWGWVAILVILVLFVTVMYLLLNKQKI